MPSKLTTGEIIGTTLGVLSVIMPLAIFFISHILQARKKGTTHRPGTSDDQESHEEDALPPPVPGGSGNVFHIREAHLSFYSEPNPDTYTTTPLPIAHPQAVLCRDTIGGISTTAISDGNLSEMQTRPMVHRINTVYNNDRSYLNCLSTSGQESTQVTPTETSSTLDPTSSPAGENEGDATCN